MRRNDRVDGVDLLALAWELRLESDDRPVDCQIQPGKQTSKYNIGIGIGISAAWQLLCPLGS